MNFLLTESPVPYLLLWLDDCAELFAVLDVEDYRFFSQWRWAAKPDKHRRKWYAYRTGSLLGVRLSVYLHVAILQRKLGRMLRPAMVGDHWNGQSLDCRRINLREATKKQNRANINGSAMVQKEMFNV